MLKAGLAAFFRHSVVIARNEVRHALRERVNQALVIWLPALALPLLALFCFDTGIHSLATSYFMPMKLAVRAGEQEQQLRPLLNDFRWQSPMTITSSNDVEGDLKAGKIDAYVEMRPDNLVRFQSRNSSINSTLYRAVLCAQSWERASAPDSSTPEPIVQGTEQAVFKWQVADGELFIECAMLMVTLFLSMYTLNFPVNCLRDAFSHNTLETDLCMPTSAEVLVTGKFLGAMFLSCLPLVLMWISVSPLLILISLGFASASMGDLSAVNVWIHRTVLMATIAEMLAFALALRMVLGFAFKQASNIANMLAVLDVLLVVITVWVFSTPHNVPWLVAAIPLVGLTIESCQLCLNRPDYWGIAIAAVSTGSGILMLLSWARYFYRFELHPPQFLSERGINSGRVEPLHSEA
jgi:hypothetical protein